MKKLITVVAAVVSAALFFGCSDSSDNNNAALLLAAANSSSSVSLPASVGINELAGKTFKSDDDSEIYNFDSRTYTFAFKGSADAIDSTREAYEYEYIETYLYSYNSITKRIYSVFVNRSIFVIRGGIKSKVIYPSFSTDEEYISVYKKAEKVFANLLSDDLLETSIKDRRYSIFNDFGYTDLTNQTEVSKEIISRYNKYNSFKLITPKQYSLSSNSATLKICNDSDYYAPGTTLQDIYSPAYARYSLTIENASEAWELNYGGQIMWPARNPAMKREDTVKGMRVSSVTANAINVCAVGTRKDTSSDYTYTDISLVYPYTASEITDGVEYTITVPILDTEFGKITINYATAANNTAETSGTAYTLVTE